MARKTRYTLAASALLVQPEELTESYYFSGDQDLRQPLRTKPDQEFELENLFAEETTSLVAVFGGTKNRSVEENLHDLDSVGEEMKSDRRSTVDSGISDLAEAVMRIMGPAQLSDRANKEPFFAGAVLNDCVAAAITLGAAGVFLFRDGTLYSLTHIDFAQELAKDRKAGQGDVLEYAAGVAGMLRYSKNVRLKQNDLMVLASLSVLNAVTSDVLVAILSENTSAAVKNRKLMDIASSVHVEDQSKLLICLHIDDVKGGFWPLKTM